jgi:hypothetical protein
MKDRMGHNSHKPTSSTFLELQYCIPGKRIYLKEVFIAHTQLRKLNTLFENLFLGNYLTLM